MSVGGNPGLTQKMRVSSVDVDNVVFSNDEGFELTLDAPAEYLANEGYVVGEDVAVHIRRVGDGKPHASHQTPPTS